MLVSQDCDIAANSGDEPWVQFVIADKQSKPYEMNHAVRSTRKLILSSKYNGETYELKIQKMCFVRKRQLLEAQISSEKIQSLIDTDLKLLKRWLTRRYNRTALPDIFNRKTKELLEGLEENIHVDLYIRLNSYEEGLENYKVALIAVPYPGEQDVNIEYIRKVLNDFIDRLDNIEGLQFDQEWIDGYGATRYMERSEMTLDLLDELNLWNLDYISLKDGDFHSRSD